MLSPGQLVALAIEKPAAGGAMIARVDGQVVLVAGAIPGERVTARIDRVGKGVAYAHTVSVDDPSPDRRDPFTDPRCGGTLYAHIEYERQLDVKAQIVADGFARIGRLTLPAPRVRPSPESGYRMRARLHVGGGRAGFFREGTHEICDAGATRQLLPATMAVVEQVVAGLRSQAIVDVRALDVSENAAATERAVQLETSAPVDPRRLAPLARTAGLTGLCLFNPARPGTSDAGPRRLAGGDPHVTDSIPIGDRRVTLRRHVGSFFQGNRYLLNDLAAYVVDRIDPNGEVVDLYAGVGLFAACVAVAHGVPVVAVEGDRSAARDLEVNARHAGGAVQAVCAPVEVFTARTRMRPRTLIMDPPRTGVSRAALEGVVKLGPPRIVYVSCDVATLARDARHLVESGYAVREVEAFDLFPNTPHVETVVVFDLAGAGRTA